MVDVCGPATLRGFPVSVADIGDRVRLCHPLLSFGDAPALYVANRLDWENDPATLTVADPDEASTLGTLLPPACSVPIASGEGVVVAGTGFVQAVAKAGIILHSEIRFSRVDGLECWIGVATPALHAALRTRLGEEAQSVFDDALGDAASRRGSLSDEGNAALFVMRKCSPGPSDDFAIRQLAGARQNRQGNLYRRLLTRFAFELDTPERDLDERVRRHLEMAVYWAVDLDRPGEIIVSIERLENSRQSASYCGTLRAVHLDKDWLIVDVRGQRVRVHGVGEQVDAIGRLINKLVTVHVATTGGKHRFVRIERAD